MPFANFFVGPRAYNLMYPGDEMAFCASVQTLNVDVLDNAPTNGEWWSVYDWYGEKVAYGKWDGGIHLNIGVVGAAPFDRYGWYTLKIADATGTCCGVCRFIIAEDVPEIPQAPLVSQPTSGTTGYTATCSQNVLDAPMAHGYFSLGGLRVWPDVSSTTSISSSNMLYGIKLAYEGWGQYQDPARPYRQITCAILGELGLNSSQVASYAQAVTATVQACEAAQPGFIGCYTGRNEPWDFSLSEAQALTSAVKAGEATAIVGGPNMVSGNFGAQPTLFQQLDQGIIGSGACEALTYHDYNMCNGDIANTVNILRALKAALTSRGLSQVPIFMTEGGQNLSYWPNFLRVRAAGTDYMLNTIAREAILGVPYERQAWYYDIRGGYDGVMQWCCSQTGPNAAWAMHRAFAREVYGKVCQGEKNLGSLGEFALAGEWRSATDGTGIVAVITARGTPFLPFKITGATSIEVVDCFGNVSSKAVGASGILAMGFGDQPTYLRLPAGVTAEPVNMDWGPSLLTVAGTVTDSASTSSLVSRVVDGNTSSCYAWSQGSDPNNDTGGTYQLDGGNFPRSITYMAPSPIMVDTLAVYAPAAWQNMGAMLSCALEYTTDGTTWVTARSFSQGYRVFEMPDPDNLTWVDTYTNPQHYFHVSMKPVMIMGVRLVIKKGTNGMYLNSLMLAPPGSPSSTTATSFPEVADVTEILAWCRSKPSTVPLVPSFIEPGILG